MTGKYLDTYQQRLDAARKLIQNDTTTLVNSITVENQNQIHGVLEAQKNAKKEAILAQKNPWWRTPLTLEQTVEEALFFEDELSYLDELAATYIPNINDNNNRA